MQIEQVDFVTIPTRDTARAVAFYSDALGLRESECTAGEVETPNVTLSFWEPAREGFDFRPHEGGIGLRVADVQAAVDEACAAGAELIGVQDTGVCHMGFVKDPDGNTVILHRRYAPRIPR
jgi:catechol 2,3-dioxygenase-like lactoylglutathione lyase family enzyme